MVDVRFVFIVVSKKLKLRENGSMIRPSHGDLSVDSEICCIETIWNFVVE
jgi:hypothetical protein